jgi:hypothetical protein
LRPHRFERGDRDGGVFVLEGAPKPELDIFEIKTQTVIIEPMPRSARSIRSS